MKLPKVGGKFSMNMAMRKVENVSEFIKMLTLCKEFLGQKKALADVGLFVNLFLLVLDGPLSK
jgi:hypothetical protein